MFLLDRRRRRRTEGRYQHRVQREAGECNANDPDKTINVAPTHRLCRLRYQGGQAIPSSASPVLLPMGLSVCQGGGRRKLARRIIGTFRGLAQGWLRLFPVVECEFEAPALPGLVCAAKVVPGEGVEPSHVLRRSGF